MNIILRCSNRLPKCVLALLLLPIISIQTAPARQRLLMDTRWRFALGHAYEPSKDFNFGTSYFFNAKAGVGDGPADADFDDRSWRLLDLPHDWAVELPFDQEGDAGHGDKRVGRAYPDSSVGWYRRTFEIPSSDLGRRISVEFDGAFRDAQVFLNGHFLGRFPSGYDSFRCDLTDVLTYGGKNTLAVRLDATLKEGWFYEGAGIYRHVWLLKTAPLHVAANGTYITTQVKEISGNTAASAEATAKTTIENESDADAVFDLQQSVVDAGNHRVAQSTLVGLSMKAGDSQDFSTLLHVDHPDLWSPDSPALYKLVTSIRQNGKETDSVDSTFGIRTLRFDADHGFFLNDQHVLIKGVCDHQDHAGVGVAVPDALNAYRIARLKEMGCNGLRTSHNPPTPELLDACDRLGMLVLDENRQTGTSAEEMGGLQELILRDRNHPSVFLWSLGNEEWKIEGNITGARVVAAQRALAHKLDPSRLVTTAVSGGWGNGSSNSLDVMGFNYYNHGDTDDYHAHHPKQPCIGTEEASAISTRGIYFDDNAGAHLSAYDVHAPKWAVTAEKWVNYYSTRPYVAGAFVWTGFDYRGEPTPFQWPAISSQFGILDTCGFAKDDFYYYQSCWTDKPMVHVLPHWNWPDRVGQTINVWCYSNCDEVELTLNGQSLGRKTIKRFGHVEWPVKYAGGRLTATAYISGQQAATDTVETTGEPETIRLLADRQTISADGHDVSVITVQVLDPLGRAVPTAMNTVSFSLSGPGRIIGVGNGDPACHEPDVYVENVKPISVDHWRTKEVDGTKNRPEVAENFDDSQWAQAGSDDESDHKTDHGAAIFRAVVEVPAESSATEAIFLSHFGSDAQVYVNGALVESLSHLDGVLRPGKSAVAVVTSKRSHEGTAGATIRLTTPAGQWKRSLFNGLAQVIVQSTETPGTIELTASGNHLADGAVTVNSHSAKPTPSVGIVAPGD